jgi:transcription initiation factor TFIIIB Brf1 subunit/transcription initiation factor TFIIB
VPSRPPHRAQRRLSRSDVADVCANYVRGCSIDELARSHHVNRTTIIKHFEHHGVPRRRVVTKMTNAQVTDAAAMYRDGHSLATVANKFDVDARTLGREFRRAGVPRQGWNY